MTYALIVAVFTAALSFSPAQGGEESRAAPPATARKMWLPDATIFTNSTQISPPAAIWSGQTSETTGRSPPRAAASSEQEDATSAAEAERVRDAVVRTLYRARESSYRPPQSSLAE